jgi:hypothetical protein
MGEKFMRCFTTSGNKMGWTAMAMKSQRLVGIGTVGYFWRSNAKFIGFQG